MKTRQKTILIAIALIAGSCVIGDFVFNQGIALAEMRPQELTDPTGILKDNEKFKGVTQTINWGFKAVCGIATITFIIKAAKSFSDENYMGAIGPTVGALLAGTALFVAFTLMN
jgi:hypothetical protein